MKPIILLLTLLLAIGATPSPVSVVYAGSLVTSMEGPVKTALARQGIDFEGEGKGSKALAHLIEAGLRKPDVFVSADEGLVDQLRREGSVGRAWTFASATLVLGYNPHSRYRRLFEQAAAGKLSVERLLRTPGLRIGRTDPALDPKGSFTSEALGDLGLPETMGTIYPEEDLLVRLETGVVDCGFLYSTESVARRIPALALPGKASLSGHITYTLAIMTSAPHPYEARRFADFILHGEGRRILEAAGLTYL